MSRPSLRRSPVTLGLCIVCGLWFLLTAWLGLRDDASAERIFASLWSLRDTDAFERTGALMLTRLWAEQEWWRVLTAGFVHGSWLHLGLNAWALAAIGPWTERAIGPARTLLLFTSASAGACLASAAWAEAPIVVGASGGIFGLAGALVVLRWRGPPELQARLAPVAAGRLALWLGVWLLVGTQLPMLANAGHAGGLLIGSLAGMALFAHKWRVLHAIAVIFAFSGLSYLAHAPFWRPNYHLFLGLEKLDRADASGALQDLERALALQPGDPELQNAVAYSLALAGTGLDRALQLASDAVTAEEDNPDFLDTLGWVHCRAGRVEAGLQALRRAEAAAADPVPEISLHLAGCADAAQKASEVPRGT